MGKTFEYPVCRQHSANRLDAVACLMRRARWLHLLATGFYFPSAGYRQRLLRDIAAMPAEDVPTPALAALEHAWTHVDENTLAEEYKRLFLGSNATVERVTAYSPAANSTELASTNGVYIGCVLDSDKEWQGVHAHPGMELDIYSLLLLKLAYAVKQDCKNKFDMARDAAKDFLVNHLGRRVDNTRARILGQPAAPVYRMLLEAVAEAIERERQMFTVQPMSLAHTKEHAAVQATHTASRSSKGNIQF